MINKGEDMKKSDGFTLVELMAVIAVLALIAIIAYPIVTGVIKTSEKKLSKEQIRTIEEAARTYTIKNGPESCGCVSIADLQSSGYLETGKIMDPETGNQLTGQVTIKWLEDKKQYTYTYGTSCGCN